MGDSHRVVFFRVLKVLAVTQFTIDVGAKYFVFSDIVVTVTGKYAVVDKPTNFLGVDLGRI